MVKTNDKHNIKNKIIGKMPKPRSNLILGNQDKIKLTLFKLMTEFSKLLIKTNVIKVNDDSIKKLIITIKYESNTVFWYFDKQDEKEINIPTVTQLDLNIWIVLSYQILIKSKLF